MTRVKSYFRMEKAALRLFGLSFRDHESIGYRIVGAVLMFNICLYPFLALGDVFKHDFEIVADLLTYECPILVGVAKVLTVVSNRKKIAKVLNKLDEGLRLTTFPSGNGDEDELLKTCSLITTLQTSLYWMSSMLAYIFAVSYTLSKRIRSSDYHDWQFPYGTFTIINATHSPNFEILWCYQVWNCAGIATYFTNIDLLIAAVLCHLCYHLKILQNYLRRIVDYTYKKMESENKSSVSTQTETVDYDNAEIVTAQWQNLNASLKAVVEYHLGIFNLIKDVDESLSILLLLTFLGTLGSMALMVFKASLIPISDVRMLRSFVELSSVVLQVLLVCFWSDQMMFEGKEVGTAAYKANFIGTDLKFQKSLMLIMRRSQTPTRLTAGFVDISLATFTWILRSTYSAYMILRRQKLKDV